jgi:hypothetical protein
MRHQTRRWLAFAFLATIASPALPQSPPEPPAPGHDISKVDPAPLGGAIAVPLPERERRRLKKYEIPELIGARQAIGSQLINGQLPKPVLDYYVRNGAIVQRISFFEGGLVVVRLAGAGGTVQKRVIIPDDALQKYLQTVSPAALGEIRDHDVSRPTDQRRAFLRLYDKDGSPVERNFDPSGARPRKLHVQIVPLEDLLRSISEDRTVTSTIAGYEPKVGDELVGDDRKIYRVERIITESGIVQLRCIGQPTTIYVAKKDLYNYFVGRSEAR